MSAIQKPEMSRETRNRLNELYTMLTLKSMTRAEISRVFNVCDRTAREMVSTVAKTKPVISTSDKKGYYIPTSPEHLNAVEHAWSEIDSRIKELEARREPLIKAYEKFKRGDINGLNA